MTEHSSEQDKKKAGLLRRSWTRFGDWIFNACKAVKKGPLSRAGLWISIIKILLGGTIGALAALSSPVFGWGPGVIITLAIIRAISTLTKNLSAFDTPRSLEKYNKYAVWIYPSLIILEIVALGNIVMKVIETNGWINIIHGQGIGNMLSPDQFLIALILIIALTNLNSLTKAIKSVSKTIASNLMMVKRRNLITDKAKKAYNDKKENNTFISKTRECINHLEGAPKKQEDTAAWEEERNKVLTKAWRSIIHPKYMEKNTGKVEKALPPDLLNYLKKQYNPNIRPQSNTSSSDLSKKIEDHQAAAILQLAYLELAHSFENETLSGGIIAEINNKDIEKKKKTIQLIETALIGLILLPLIIVYAIIILLVTPIQFIFRALFQRSQTDPIETSGFVKTLQERFQFKNIVKRSVQICLILGTTVDGVVTVFQVVNMPGCLEFNYVVTICSILTDFMIGIYLISDLTRGNRQASSSQSTWREWRSPILSTIAVIVLANEVGRFLYFYQYSTTIFNTQNIINAPPGVFFAASITFTAIAVIASIVTIINWGIKFCNQTGLVNFDQKAAAVKDVAVPENSATATATQEIIEYVIKTVIEDVIKTVKVVAIPENPATVKQKSIEGVKTEPTVTIDKNQAETVHSKKLDNPTNLRAPSPIITPAR